MRIHEHSLHNKVFDIWRSPERFTKNPDIIRLASGRLLLVYADTDQHWASTYIILTLLRSDDDGRTWEKHAEIDRADLTKGEERLVTPRLSLLNDGRLVVLCDRDDDGHFHPDQTPANLAWWSTDNGDSWGPAQETNMMGFEPDRILDLPDGRLGVLTQIMRPHSQEFAEILCTSSDGGKTWKESAEVAHDGYHRFCEGALVFLDNGDLACILRENHSAGIPCFVTFSKDGGNSWSPAQMCPFAVHRPYAKQLADGRVLVTGRHVNGGLGTYAWCGDLRSEAGSYQIGGPRRKFSAKISQDALIIENKPDHECRYSLLPPENGFSEVVFEAEVKVTGSEPAAFLSVSRLKTNRGPVVLYLTENNIFLNNSRKNYSVDLSNYQKIKIHHRKGLLQISVNGTPVLSASTWHESDFTSDFGRSTSPHVRTMFGQTGDQGSSSWKQVSYKIHNRNLPDWQWEWSAKSGLWPDQYQRDRLTQIHGNHPDQNGGSPDHGYSSWLQLEDGKIIFVDYTNLGDQPAKSHLVGAFIQPHELV